MPSELAVVCVQMMTIWSRCEDEDVIRRCCHRRPVDSELDGRRVTVPDGFQKEEYRTSERRRHCEAVAVSSQ